MKKVFRVFLIIVLIPVGIFIAFLIYSSITDYKPELHEEIARAKGKVIDVRDTLQVFNWNIGYAGLGDDMSFFYDGGDRMRTSEGRTTSNLKAIANLISKYSSFDFLMFQEVDLDSKRSYNINQFDVITSNLPNHSAYFAYNYKVNFVPVPVKNPLGRTRSGLASYSKHDPFLVERTSFKGNYSWPMGLFMLDRCYMVQRFFTSDGSELVLINTHNSAYDDGSLRYEQMKILREFLLSEYEQGHYVVVGGDWNQMPPNDSVQDKEYSQEHLTRIRIKSDFMPQKWEWVYGEQIPTNRMINEVYNPKTTNMATIDFFLISPNICNVDSEVIDLKFKNSDHQPQTMTFAFKR